jgi:hypothetical protein
MAYNQHATMRKILEFTNEEIYGGSYTEVKITLRSITCGQ